MKFKFGAPMSFEIEINPSFDVEEAPVLFVWIKEQVQKLFSWYNKRRKIKLEKKLNRCWIKNVGLWFVFGFSLAALLGIVIVFLATML